MEESRPVPLRVPVSLPCAQPESSSSFAVRTKYRTPNTSVRRLNAQAGARLAEPPQLFASDLSWIVSRSVQPPDGRGCPVPVRTGGSLIRIHVDGQRRPRARLKE